MCGIVGYLDAGRTDVGSRQALIRQMADAISHRGPDADGYYIDDQSGVTFGHRRLSILDLSPAGAQPMFSADRRWVLIFNGEIYNFEEMRAALEADVGAIAWRGHSDTEILLEAIARWGFEKALKHTNGMFAFAVWDQKERQLFFARDRLGEKPFYYGWQGNAFVFGSELKALAVHPSFARRLDPAAVQAYLTFGYVPAPYSIYQGIRKLAPAHYMRLSADTPAGTVPEIRAYWEIPRPDPKPCDEAQAIQKLDVLLRDSVRMRMRADVTMGAFLSGGIDSSTVVALMQAQSATPVKTFSIGFEEDEYNEAVHAARVAKHLGTTHIEMHVSAQDALNVVPQLPQLYDEPFADSSQIPTYLLSKLTREHVTVSLSGDGGDEVFAGYGRYFTFGSIWNKISPFPRPVRRLAGAVTAMVPGSVWSAVPKLLPFSVFREVRPGRMKRLAEAVGSRDEQQFYKFLMSYWSNGQLMKHPVVPEGLFFNQYNIKRDFSEPVLGMSFVDTGSYLPDDILVKVDRAGMAVSLEGRIPLLDHRVLEFAAGLPFDQKVRGTTGKWLLRQVLHRYVPRELIDRPKMGFGIPLEQWLRGALKEWSRDLLFDERSSMNGVIDLTPVRKTWEDHQAGRSNESYRLWDILMLMAWAREWQPV